MKVQAKLVKVVSFKQLVEAIDNDDAIELEIGDKVDYNGAIILTMHTERDIFEINDEAYRETQYAQDERDE